MGAWFQFPLLFLCWLAALATLLVFLETWFGLSGRNRFIARRASGAYGVISVFVPMYGRREKVEKTLRSVLGQSYPFVELVLIYSEENRQLSEFAPWRRRSRPRTAVGSSFWIRMFCSTGLQLKLQLNLRDPTKCPRSLFIPVFDALRLCNKSLRPRWSNCFR